MTRKMLQLLILSALVGTIGERGAAQGPAVDARAAFNVLKTLEGHWAASPDSNRQSTVRFELSANGTVIVEHYVNPVLPGGGHMMSAYHLDGRDLLLTHYCIANNQPTLRAERFDASTGVVQFEFIRATNLASPGAGHMHRAKYRLLDSDHFVTEWEFFENGVRKMTETETFSRVK